MTTSPVSSPAIESTPSSPSQLTPRSKVKALLASLDDDSETEKTLSFLRKDHRNGPNSLAISSADQVETRFQSNIGNTNGADDDEGTEDEDVILKPRGRLAARMLAVRVDGEGDGDDEAETARDRVRKLFMSTKEESPKTISTRGGTSDETNNAASPVSRKRKLGRPQVSTPISSPPIANRTSPGGLFVSPSSQHFPSPVREGSGSDDDLPSNPNANARFLALVQKKREERLAKEVEIDRQKAVEAAERVRLSKNHSDILEDDAIEYSDDDNGRRLTQQARPTRKASKRALEEMHRETQRMSRNMQLAHEARTKKKITKSSLFAKFNYKPAGFEEIDPVDQSGQISSSSPPHTDLETRDTPPTSPASYDGDTAKAAYAQNSLLDTDTRHSRLLIANEKKEISSLEDVDSRNTTLSSPEVVENPLKGKEKAPEQPCSLPESELAFKDKPITIGRPLRIKPLKIALKGAQTSYDSDSDLEIVSTQTPPRKPKDSIFDRVPAKQARVSHSLHALRMLAHIKSPGKQPRGKKGKPSMTSVELQMSLQQRARQQAAREREERLQALRASGVIVQTAEERKKEITDMEDLMAKARREAEEIMKREKEIAKKERKANGEAEPLEDSSDDEDWVEEKERLAEQISGYGSESDDDDNGDASGEEELEDDDEDAMSANEDESELAAPKPIDSLIDNEASETDSAEEDPQFSDEENAADFINDREGSLEAAHDEVKTLLTEHVRRRAKRLVVSDDEDNDDVAFQSPAVRRTESPTTRNMDSPIAPPSVLRSATKTFIPGLTVAGPAGLGLTQIFAGTMDDNQMQSLVDSQDVLSLPVQEQDYAQDSLAFLRNLPAPELLTFEPTMNEDSQEIVRDSQTQRTQIPESPLIRELTQNIHLHFSQSQTHEFDSMLQDPTATQYSEFPEPTQDAGFQTMSPIKGRFVELAPSTIDTVIVDQRQFPNRVTESPIEKKKGKLRRRADLSSASKNEHEGVSEVVAPTDANEFDISESVFDVMRKASKKKEGTVDDFNKKNSAAKEMVEEQAEESEDEYAGLGGASDDESGGEDDALVKAMIDDEGGKDMDASKLAAFYADKERKNDEKQVEKLFNDITKGMLRRKRGADYDLSDSDDGGEARRRMKRKEFAKMRKALLEDERIGKIAENPKKMAFLRAIEDRGEENEMDFLEDLAEPEEPTDSQSQSPAEASQNGIHQVDNSQADVAMGPPKRKLSDDAEPSNRLPPHLRRTKQAKRPSNLSEIRQSLSSLIEDPNAILESQDLLGSDSEPEDDASGTERPELKEKENRDPFASRRKTSIAAVDRISLKRATSNTTSISARLAFAAPSSTPGFKVPALLRRTTTSTSITSGSSTSSVSGTERTAGGFGDDGKFTKKAGKNSGVHYFARENERRMKVEESEKRRKEKRFKGAEGRRKVVGGLFGMGRFE